MHNNIFDIIRKEEITEGGMDTNEELARTQKRTRLYGGR